MEGLFSFLGKYGKQTVLSCDDDELENLMTLLFPERITIDEKITDPEVLADKVIEMCKDYLNFVPEYNDKFYPLIKDAKDIWEDSINFFVTQIKDDFITDLKYLMIASWRYTVSLQKSPEIINGTKNNPSEYIAIFDFEGIKKKGEGRTQLRKLVQNSSEAVLANIDKKGSIFPTNMSLTVLPQFIRRYHDMGIDFEDNASLNTSKEKKVSIMNSIFDIGPVLSLLSASTPRKNPYIIDPSTEGSIEQAIKDIKGKYINPSYAKIIDLFVREFISAPIIVLSQKLPTHVQSTTKVLEKVCDLAEKKREESDVLDFLRSISPEELAVFNQYTIERFAHACYLQSLFNTRKTLSKNISAYAEEEVRFFLKDKYCSVHGDEGKNPFDSCPLPILFNIDSTIERTMCEASNYSVQLLNEYIREKCFYISLLPLPLTRISIINAMLDLHAFSSIRKKNIKISKIEILMQLFSIYTLAVKRLIDFYLYITVPILIIVFHYYVNTNKDNIVFSKDNINKFFKKYVSYYDFYRYDGDDKSGNLCVNECNAALKKWGNVYVDPAIAVKDEFGFEANYIEGFYKVFYLFSSWEARGSKNTFSKIVEKAKTGSYTDNKECCKEMDRLLTVISSENMQVSLDNKLQTYYFAEFAMICYVNKKISLEAGAKLAGMTLLEFGEYLANNGVNVFGDETYQTNTFITTDKGFIYNPKYS